MRDGYPRKDRGRVNNLDNPYDDFAWHVHFFKYLLVDGGDDNTSTVEHIQNFGVVLNHWFL